MTSEQRMKLKAGDIVTITHTIRPQYWNVNGDMDELLNGEPRLIEKIEIVGLYWLYIKFEGLEEPWGLKPRDLELIKSK